MNDSSEFLHLTPAEAAALADRDFLPLKHRVSQKIDAALLDLRDRLLPLLAKGHWPAPVRQTPPKLSRGENYHHYAYRVLDCPRVFAGADMLAFRSLVLWGHPIGYHLMLAGHYRDTYLPRLLARYQDLPEGAWLSVQETPWIWEADAPGLLPLATLEPDQLRAHLHSRDFIKVSYFLPLQAYEQLPSQGLAYWQAWQDLLAPA